VAPDPRERLAELLREAGRHRDAIREFGLAGYVTMVEQHQAKLHEVYDRIRRHCEEQGLDLPPEIPGPLTDPAKGVLVLDRRRSKGSRFPWVVLCEVQGANDGSSERYVVWYEDQRGRRSIGYYTTSQEDAQAELKRRT
jgi:hypothetical protein